MAGEGMGLLVFVGCGVALILFHEAVHVVVDVIRKRRAGR